MDGTTFDDPASGTGDDRTAELASRLAAVTARLAHLCHEVGRSPAEVTLVAVTKTWPADDVIRLAHLGVTDVAENRHQEALVKRAAVCLPLRWHHVGAVQRNKAAAIAGWADIVQSLDREALVVPLARARPGLEVLLQVSLDDDPARAGAAPRDVVALGLRAAEAGLLVRGVMAVAPLGADPAPAFAQLAEVSRELRGQLPAATWLSAGMSGDWEQAVAAGATHLRLGTVLLGHRGPPPV